MKQHLKSIISLTVICAVLAVLLALGNAVTAPIIAETEKAAANASLLVVMPNGESFEELDISALELPDTVKQAYKSKTGGFVVTVESAGYSSGLVVMCGVDAEGKITGATCLSSSETLGYEKNYGEKTVGATLQTVDSLDSIAGATKTVNGYKSALKIAINAAIVLGGGEADMRSEEEILQDSLKEALASGDKFSEKFICDSLVTPDVSAVYEAQNKSGYVFKVGDKFIGVKADGSNVEGTYKTDLETIKGESLSEIDITKYVDLPTQIKKAYKTAKGNFVFDIEASGYGIMGDKWTASGKPIEIRVSVSKDNKIISCKTVSQSESKGFGDACADSKFYSQFSGKESSNVTEIDGISGATITTNGYITAVSKVFEAVNLMKGE